MSRLEWALFGAMAACWCATGLAWLAWLKTSRALRRFMAGPPDPDEALARVGRRLAEYERRQSRRSWWRR